MADATPTIPLSAPLVDPAVRPAPPRRRLSSRVPPSLAVAVVAGGLAALLYLAASADHSGDPVAVAARDIRTGEPLRAGDVRFSDVRAADEVLATMIRRDDLEALDGFVATHTIAAGAVLSRRDLAPAAGPNQQRAMSVPVDPEHAVGGALGAGDRVDVLDGSTDPPSYVASGAEVLAVAKPSSAGLSGGTRAYSITLAVDSQTALRLARAIANDKIEVVRATGAAPGGAG